MRSGSVVAILCAAVLPNLVAGIQLCEDPVEALRWFNYGIPVPSQCVSQLSAQATEFCRGYLGLAPVTSYTSTVTPSAPAPVTVVSTITTQTTVTAMALTTVPTTLLIKGGTVTETETETTTAVTTNYLRRKKKRDPAVVPVALHGGCGRCIDISTSCLELTEPNLLRRSPYRLNEYCRCLGIPLTTVTAEAITAAVATSTERGLAVETEVLSETVTATSLSFSFTISVATVTTTTTATETTTYIPI
ncbi:hypothetical protein GE09DRAFT_445016 [Coniochaeta sp. 2T2.1]|nr:hypothetical protein GE09DRAFT_445016 [Coniochaeta sp. 2T2.1]